MTRGAAGTLASEPLDRHHLPYKLQGDRALEYPSGKMQRGTEEGEKGTQAPVEQGVASFEALHSR